MLYSSCFMSKLHVPFNDMKTLSFKTQQRVCIFVKTVIPSLALSLTPENESKPANYSYQHNFVSEQR